jgi:hypothetical protein
VTNLGEALRENVARRWAQGVAAGVARIAIASLRSCREKTSLLLWRESGSRHLSRPDSNRLSVLCIIVSSVIPTANPTSAVNSANPTSVVNPAMTLSVVNLAIIATATILVIVKCVSLAGRAD